MKLLLVLVMACGGAQSSKPPAQPPPVAQAPSCREVIAPMVERQVSATVREIVVREHLDAVESQRLADLAHTRAVELAASMVRSCTEDNWSAAARSCYGAAHTADEFRVCDRYLTGDQKQRVIARAGL